MKTATEPDTAVTAAITDLQTSLEESARRGRALSRELEQLKRARRSGQKWREILEAEKATRALPMLGEVLRRLADSGSSFRRTLALALVSEGEGLSEIGRRFGVSRQRVYSLTRAVPTSATRPDGAEAGA